MGKRHGFSGWQAISNLENPCSFLLNLIPIIPSSCGNIHLKRFVEFHVIASHVIEAQVVHIPIPLVENNSIPDATELVKAYDLFQNFKRLLVDLILCFDDRKKSQYFFKEISLDKAFKVIEIELSLIYDMLYPEVTIIHSFLGWGFCLLSFSFTGIALYKRIKGKEVMLTQRENEREKV